MGQFQHVGYQHACTPAEKFNGDAFTNFHAILHAIFMQFHAILAISAFFWPILTCWACTGAEKFNGDTFTHFQTLLHTIFMQFHAILAISDIFRQFQHEQEEDISEE